LVRFSVSFGFFSVENTVMLRKHYVITFVGVLVLMGLALSAWGAFGVGLTIDASLARLAVAVTGYNQYNPEKCSCGTGEGVGANTCATHVGGHSVDPTDGTLNFTISLPGTGNWSPSLSYCTRDDLWEYSENMRLEKAADDLVLVVNAAQRVYFHWNNTSWVVLDSPGSEVTLVSPWGFALIPGDPPSPVPVGGDTEEITVHHDSSRQTTKYVFNGFSTEIGENLRGSLKTISIAGESTSFVPLVYGASTSVRDARGRVVTYQFWYDDKREIIEPHPLGYKDGTFSPLDNEHGRLTIIELDEGAVTKVSVGMPKTPEADPSAADPSNDEGDYYWRTTLLRYSGGLAAVVNPDQYFAALDDADWRGKVRGLT